MMASRLQWGHDSNYGTLPLEIVQEIIKWNSDDRNDLRAYSFVSRIWREASLQFLFYDITFTDERQLEGWNRRLRHSTHIVKSVRRMRFWPSPVASNPLPYLPSIDEMPGVTDIEWDSHTPTRITPSLIQFLRNFSNLRRVTLASEFADVESLRMFLGACGSNITTLVLEEGVRCRSKSTTSRTTKALNKWSRSKPFPQFDLSKLKHFSIRSERTFFDWVYDDLLLASMPLHLHSLTIESEAFSVPTLCRLIDTFSATLSHLTLDPTDTYKTIFSGREESIALRPLPSSLSPLQALRTLTLGLIFFGDHFEPHSALNWVCDSLEVFRADNLVVLELFCYASEPKEMTDVLQKYNWVPFVALIQRKYKSVQDLVLWITMEMDFGRRERSSLEQQVHESQLSKFAGHGKQLDVKWTIENPS
ncbi:hypothetical protein Moror_13221 [Moniliophthora roreri MCA 2997]|uniref:F-box domain-containing protein n=1 Tax=Moniliophthora roreri (strain MCA 2997) TaxID=1381753 RepID=V2YB64_MONRO|nr:hypothetical protein Moror_13221 [Moniliophthora roreri MCA 2997]